MINWRKPVMNVAFLVTGRPVFQKLKFIKSLEYKPLEEIQKLQSKKLEQILKHAYEKVPYYNKVLPEAGIVKNNEVVLENFDKIPILTKDIIRKEGQDFYSRDYKERGPYYNYSGGSTGQPITLLQDRNYQTWGFAFRFYFCLMVGKDSGQRELQLWGSERDIFEGAEKITTRLRRWGFNLLLLNSFSMSEGNMKDYIAQWNNFKPVMVLTYTSSIYEFGKFIKKNNLKVFTPASIVCTAETLTEDVRKYTEEVFDCPVLNSYGSREVGIIASECIEAKSLHTFPLHNKIEILDENLKPCVLGQIGNVYITTLNSYSMPLIRYQIGDTAVISDKKQCSCGRTWPLIAAVTGRTSDHFRTREGKLIHGEYFTHLFYGQKNISKFRVIQHDFEDVEILIESDKPVEREILQKIEDKIKLVLGVQCKVTFNEVDEIQPTESGKYLFTISKISQ